MAKTANKDQLTWVTPPLRVAFPVLFKAKSVDGKDDSKKRFSMTLLIPKSETDIIKQIKAYIAKALTAEFGSKENWPNKKRMPLEDGDGVSYAGYAGHYALKCTCNEEYPPLVVGKDRQPIIDQAEIYAGCWLRAQLYFRAYNMPASKGVQAIINMVQKVKDDEPFVKGRDPKLVFDDLSGADSDDFEDEQEDFDDFEDIGF